MGSDKQNFSEFWILLKEDNLSKEASSVYRV